MNWDDFARALALAGSLSIIVYVIHLLTNDTIMHPSRRIAAWLIAGVAGTEAAFWAFVLFIPERYEWWFAAAAWLSRTMDYLAIILLFAILRVILQAESKGR